MKKPLFLIVVLLMAISCTNQNDPTTAIPTDAKPIALKAGMEKRISQDNEFAFDLLKKTIAGFDQSNVFVSPLSVSIALGMAWNGANGQTRTEMETALKMSGMSVSDINEYYKLMQTTLPTIDPTTKLSIANSLWYRTGFPVKSDFLQINSDYFNAYVRELDFSQAWAKDTINNWCSEKTNKLIPSIIDNISPDMRMYLINAVYFKGIWRQKFETKNTVEANFTNELGTVVKVNMMSQTDTFAYAQDNYAKYLDMPYGNKAFSMTIILPNEEKTTADVLNYLTPANWNNALSTMTKGEVMVKIPRFKVENKFKLNNVLKSMGINLAFLDLADFSKMSVKPLMISEVLHKTYVVVNEEGTEAAAVTSVGMMTNSIPVVKEFIVNKPFLYLIREKSTGVILFIGKMGNVEKY